MDPMQLGDRSGGPDPRIDLCLPLSPLRSICPLAPTPRQETLIDGHSGDVYNVAFHPTKGHVLATVSDSGHVHLWDCSIRQMTHCAVSGERMRGGAWFVHESGGGAWVLHASPLPSFPSHL